MNKIRFYRIDLDYVKYLWSFDNRVQYNKNADDSYNRKRPYIGIVFEINNYKYFAPLEHPRLSHINIKNNVHIMKIKDGKYGLIAFNNMIPVRPESLISFEFSEEDEHYQSILKNQFIFCDRHKKEILLKAKLTYEKVTMQHQKFFKKVCCDFKLLEEKCDLYSNKLAYLAI